MQCLLLYMYIHVCTDGITWSTKLKYSNSNWRLQRKLKQVLSSSWDRRPFGHNRPENWVWGCAPLGEAELGPHLTQCGPGWGLPPYQVASWSIQPFGHNRQGPRIIPTQAKFRKWGGGCCAPFCGEQPGPHLTQYGQGRGLPAVHAKFHLDPSNHLATIHQRHSQTERTGQTGQRSDCIGRTIL